MTANEVRDLAVRIVGKRAANAATVAGIVWVREHSGRRYAMVPSATNPGTYHKVTAHTCDCAGYQHRGYCRHHDAVLLRLARRQPQPAVLPGERIARLAA